MVPSGTEKVSNNAARSEIDLLLEAARLFFAKGGVSVVGESPGYSGSTFFRVESCGREWLLRRWPAGFGAGWLRFVHGVLTESHAQGFQGVPRLARTDHAQTIVETTGRLYDAQELLPGRPLCAQHPGTGRGPCASTAVPHASNPNAR